DNNGLIESSLIYADSSYRWLGGVEDLDEPGDPRNWIRSGTYQVPNESTNPANDYNMPNKPLDPDQNYEKIVNGTWAPYVLCAASDQENNGPAFSLLSKISAQLDEVYSVDIVFTPDKSKWTRSAVIEMRADPTQSQGNVPRFRFRGSPSVDKDGNFAAPGSGPSDNPDAPNYIADSSMSWFPGYAINVETGERLNIMFGEDSWLVEDNGRDMKFNPTSSLTETFGNARFGGKHYVYVMSHVTRNPSPDAVYDFPAYDGCKYLRNIVNHFEVPAIVYMGAMFSTVSWVGIPLAVDGKDWLENEARVRIRVAKPYGQYYSTKMDSALVANSQNGQLPMYRFETESVATEYNNPDKAESDLDLIQVVPNPYYAYAGGAGYERNALDNRVKITNLPEQCVISIYNISGTLIRQITKDEEKTSVDWDLKNFAGVPIAGGVYIIHVKSDSGEKIVKWFGGLRIPDLNVF
ncbi:MAG: T9SS type A sorting domain-containing protein, partial [Bacteroidales bacterium]|nr:T9SS type A sorting domain-containing protein [Bacteroidales bacterium]